MERRSFTRISRAPVCIVGANLSFRREVFDEIGLFAPKFQLVKDVLGATEDYELQRRLWQSGRQGRYVPDIVVTADVQAERLTKTLSSPLASGARWQICRDADG